MYPKRIFTEEEQQQIIADYPAISLRKQADRLGVAPQVIRRVLLENGIQIRSRKGNGRPKREYCSELDDRYYQDQARTTRNAALLQLMRNRQEA